MMPRSSTAHTDMISRDAAECGGSVPGCEAMIDDRRCSCRRELDEGEERGTHTGWAASRGGWRQELKMSSVGDGRVKEIADLASRPRNIKPARDWPPGTAVRSRFSSIVPCPWS